jgi:hypothetical protein
MNNGQAEIVVKLLSSGRYVWSIGLNIPINERTDGIKIIKSIDGQLKEQFPEYCKRGSGRTVDLGEE